MPSGLWLRRLKAWFCVNLLFLDSLPMVAECNKPRCDNLSITDMAAGCNKPRAATGFGHEALVVVG